MVGRWVRGPVSRALAAGPRTQRHRKRSVRPLRAALQALPSDADVSMPLEVWDALTGHIFAKVASSPNYEPAELDDREAAAMGKFWLGIASGKLTPLPFD